jgi:hypothetical protein
LLRYDENSAGGDDGEGISESEWKLECADCEMRIQAENASRYILSMWSMMKTDWKGRLR